MEHIPFILWMCLYPLCNSASNYIDVEWNKKINPDYKHSAEQKFIAHVIFVIIYIGVALHLN